MRLYDAKYNQTCKICNFTISHNKQGRFTLHLKIQHHISLNEYLISYYYSSDELNCSYELCENKVKLYRGKPKKFCSNACASRNKAKPNICHVCGKKFDTTVRPHRATKTCSKYCENQLRSNSTYNWHKSMSKQQKDEHFTKIISKTAMTRKKNHTPSWNSGKTGIYSQEVIKKIRKSTLKQMENKVFRKTKIEILMEVFLKEFKIAYTYSFILENRQFDFYLKDYNILIECDGDYWHANPKFYPNPADWQLERIIIDKEKDELANNNGYKIIRFWEDDIINNFDYVKSIILDLLATTQLETVNVNAQKQQVKKDNQQPSSFKMEKVQRPSKPHVIRGRK